MQSHVRNLSVVNNDSAPRHNAGAALSSERDPSAFTEISRDLVSKRSFRAAAAARKLRFMTSKTHMRENARAIADALDESMARRKGVSKREGVSKQVSITPQCAAGKSAQQAGTQATQVQEANLSTANKHGAQRHDGADANALYLAMIQRWKSAKLEVSKEVSHDALLLYTSTTGDIYLLYFDDAVLAARELGVTLYCNKEGLFDVPFCSLPRFGGESYINQILGNGHYVAILEREGPATALACDLAIQEWSLPTETGWVM